jgi:predicted DNA-binding protein YlxM (UPF0122 family)
MEAMGFRLKEIKQLILTVLEIADANHIPREQSVSKLLKDVDEQYDRKLGFESKVKEKRNEIQSLNSQINYNRLALKTPNW